MIDFAILQNSKLIKLNDINGMECVEINRSSPTVEYNNLNYETDDGERETRNAVFNPFEIEVKIFVKHKNEYDKALKRSELDNLLVSRRSFYIVNELMPGKRYPVQTMSVEPEEELRDSTIYSVVFNCFKAYSESIESTMCKQDVTTQSWQFSQGLLPIDYEYSFKRSNFSIFNIGDFAIDPRRKHYLRIVLKGESDGKVTITNKTNNTRFVYDKSLSSKKGETIELLGIEPYKNGVSCGIDCNKIGPIILEPGENKIQVQNTSDIEVFFDFRFLYRT